MFAKPLTPKKCEIGNGDNCAVPGSHKFQRDKFPQVSNKTPTRKVENIVKKISEKKLACSRSLSDLLADENLQKEVVFRRKTKAAEGAKMGSLAESTSRRLAPTEIDQPAETDGAVGGAERLPGDARTEAARRVRSLLMLRAWRQRRVQADLLKQNVEFLTCEVDSLQRQIFVLRKLLETEKGRVSTANGEMYRMLRELDEKEAERHGLVIDKDELLTQVASLSAEIIALETTIANEKNEVLTARSEAQQWEKQLQKEREKLAKLRGEKKALTDESQTKDDLLALKTRSLERLTQSNKELQSKLDAHMPIWEETMTQLDAAHEMLKKSSEFQKRQELRLTEREEEVNDLTLELQRLESTVLEQTAVNGELGKSVSEKTQELTVVQRKLGELTEKRNSWRGAVGHMATVCARVPGACLYTLAILLVPRPLQRGF